MSPAGILARLRRICLGFPEAVETVTFGHPTFRAGKKTFAVFERYRGQDTICFKATLEDQALLTLDRRYFVAPYVGGHGWTSLGVEAGVDWEEVEELLRESYRLVAAKRLVELLDQAPRARGRKRTKRK